LGVIERHLHFEPRPASVRAARRMVASALEDDGFTGDRDTVLLLVSELVTNAVRHAATPFDVTVQVEGNEVTVAVVDHDRTHRPQVQNPPPEATSGRGLRIVQELSSSWGTESLGGDLKRVWFRLA
jgi:two-component sensor histidine kinase